MLPGWLPYFQFGPLTQSSSLNLPDTRWLPGTRYVRGAIHSHGSSGELPGDDTQSCRSDARSIGNGLGLYIKGSSLTSLPISVYNSPSCPRGTIIILHQLSVRFSVLQCLQLFASSFPSISIDYRTEVPFARSSTLLYSLIQRHQPIQIDQTTPFTWTLSTPIFSLDLFIAISISISTFFLSCHTRSPTIPIPHLPAMVVVVIKSLRQKSEVRRSLFPFLSPFSYRPGSPVPTPQFSPANADASSNRQSHSQTSRHRPQQRWSNLRRNTALRLGQTTLEIVQPPFKHQAAGWGGKRNYNRGRILSLCDTFSSLPLCLPSI